MKRFGLLSIFLLALSLFAAISGPVQAQGCGIATNWWSKDELTGNDYILVFKIPSRAKGWRLVGYNSGYQRVINTAVSQGGIMREYYAGGTKVIEFSTGGRARWGNRYFGSLNDYRQKVGIYWW